MIDKDPKPRKRGPNLNTSGKVSAMMCLLFRKWWAGQITDEQYKTGNDGLYKLRDGMAGNEVDKRLKELSERAANVIPLKRA